MKKNNYQQFNQIIKGVGVITLSFFFVFLSVSLIAKAGNLTPDGTPVGTMHSLSEIAGTGFVQATHSLKAVYDKINGLVTDLWNKPTADLTDTDRVGGFVVERLDQTISSRAAASTALSSANWTDARAGYLDAIVGSYSNSSTTPVLTGNILEKLSYLTQNFDTNHSYGSNDPDQVLTSISGNYLATYLIPGNVKEGISFGNQQLGTYNGNDSWTYGSDDASKVLTTADASGSYNVANLSVGTVKKDTSFGVSLTGDYPSSTYPLPSADATTDLSASDNNITSANGSVEWWKSDGTRQTVTLDFPELSNLCSSDTSNNSAGQLSITASKVLVGTTYCSVAGTFDPWTPQKYVRWEDWKSTYNTYPTEEYTGEEATWTQTASGGTAASVTDNGTTITLASNTVYQDERTSRYWTDRTTASIDNEFKRKNN